MQNNPTFITNNSKVGVRNTQERSDVGFYEGQNPQQIYHRFLASNRGIIGDDVVSSPTTLDDIRVPHQPIMRDGIGAGARPRGNPVVSDETAYIPAWAVGDPR